MKRYLISSGVTFASVFLVVLGAQLETLDTTTISGGALAALVVVAARAGVKAIWEKYANK